MLIAQLLLHSTLHLHAMVRWDLAMLCKVCSPPAFTHRVLLAAETVYYYAVCSAGYGAIMQSRTSSRSGDGTRKPGEELYCTACKTGYYNTGLNIMKCLACACSQPPVCNVYTGSCVKTSGQCVWGPAQDGFACTVSGVDGTCKSGDCVTGE